LATVTFAFACGNNEEPKKKVMKEITPAFDISQIDSSASPCEDFEKFCRR